MKRHVILRGGHVVTMDDRRRKFVGDVWIHDGTIRGVAPSAAAARWKVPPGAQNVDVDGHVVIPGLVQSHVHFCQTLFRGLAERRPLLPWLHERIWPLEAAHDEESIAASARLSIAELLLGGATAALDMGTVAHTDVLFSVAAEMGFRLTSGKAMMDAGDERPAGLRETTDESIAQTERLIARWHGAGDGLLRYAAAPRFILSCTPKLMRKTAALAREAGCLLHTHSSENPGEIEAVKAATGQNNIFALKKLGYVGRDVVLAHCVWLSPREFKALVDTQTGIAHCPSANLKLASGIAPIKKLIDAGARIGIGSDGAPCNNRLSMFTEMRSASLLQMPEHGADVMPPSAVLELATRGGADLLHMDDAVGSLARGKRADVTVVDIGKPHHAPMVDPIAALVYSAEAADIRHVFVDGRWKVRDGELLGVNMRTLVSDAVEHAKRVAKRAGIPLPATT